MSSKEGRFFNMFKTKAVYGIASGLESQRIVRDQGEGLGVSVGGNSTVNGLDSPATETRDRHPAARIESCSWSDMFFREPPPWGDVLSTLADLERQVNAPTG